MKDFRDLRDEELVDLVVKREKEVYSLIVERYEKKLLRYARYLARDDDLARDIAAERSFPAGYTVLLTTKLSTE